MGDRHSPTEAAENAARADDMADDMPHDRADAVEEPGRPI